jgi:hypothetical protein
MYGLGCDCRVFHGGPLVGVLIIFVAKIVEVSQQTSGSSRQ